MRCCAMRRAVQGRPACRLPAQLSWGCPPLPPCASPPPGAAPTYLPTLLWHAPWLDGLQAEAPPTGAHLPRRQLWLKLPGQPLLVLPLPCAGLCLAPLAGARPGSPARPGSCGTSTATASGGALQFEPLLVVDKGSCWELPAPLQAPEQQQGGPECRHQGPGKEGCRLCRRHVTLHLIYVQAGGGGEGCEHPGSVAALAPGSQVLGVGALALPEPLPQAAGWPPAGPTTCWDPISADALSRVRLLAPDTGEEVGWVTLAARLLLAGASSPSLSRLSSGEHEPAPLPLAPQHQQQPQQGQQQGQQLQPWQQQGQRPKQGQKGCTSCTAVCMCHCCCCCSSCGRCVPVVAEQGQRQGWCPCRQRRRRSVGVQASPAKHCWQPSPSPCQQPHLPRQDPAPARTALTLSAAPLLCTSSAPPLVPALQAARLPGVPAAVAGPQLPQPAPQLQVPSKWVQGAWVQRAGASSNCVQQRHEVVRGEFKSQQAACCRPVPRSRQASAQPDSRQKQQGACRAPQRRPRSCCGGAGGGQLSTPESAATLPAAAATLPAAASCGELSLRSPLRGRHAAKCPARQRRQPPACPEQHHLVELSPRRR